MLTLPSKSPTCFPFACKSCPVRDARQAPINRFAREYVQDSRDLRFTRGSLVVGNDTIGLDDFLPVSETTILNHHTLLFCYMSRIRWHSRLF